MEWKEFKGIPHSLGILLRIRKGGSFNGKYFVEQTILEYLSSDVGWVTIESRDFGDYNTNVQTLKDYAEFLFGDKAQ